MPVGAVSNRALLWSSAIPVGAVSNRALLRTAERR